MTKQMIPIEEIASKIFLIRGHRVMLDRDLAEIYGIATRNLNKAVTRNPERFPSEFMFRLNKQEFENLMFQSGTSSWGGTRKLPRVFTEQGVAMLSSVLKSKTAIQVNIAIMKTFVKLRKIFSAHGELADKLFQLEKKIKKHDEEIVTIFEAIRQLMSGPVKTKEKIGFVK